MGATKNKSVKNIPKVLSDIRIRNAKLREKPYKLFDHGGMGLYILITPRGSKLWQLRYRMNGRERRASLGKYPIISLSEARKRAVETQRLINQGVDPIDEKRALKSEKFTFAQLAREWIEKTSNKWSEGHTEKIRRRFERHILPWLGNRSITTITTPEILAVLRRIENVGANDLAHRCQQYVSSVFRYGTQCRLLPYNPALDLRGALVPAKTRHLAAITEPIAVGQLLRAIDSYQGVFTVKCALRILPLVFTRVGELRGMTWAEIDFDSATWRIPGERMKMKTGHIVPLSQQVIGILREIQPLTGEGRLVFPNERTTERPISENSLNAALRRLGYPKEQICSHGFRSTASSLLNELGYPSDAIELQLGYRERGVRSIYHRAENMEEKRQMMQQWADYLDSLKGNGAALNF